MKHEFVVNARSLLCDLGLITMTKRAGGSVYHVNFMDSSDDSTEMYTIERSDDGVERITCKPISNEVSTKKTVKASKLLEAVAEQEKEIDALKEENAELKEENDELRKQVEELTNSITELEEELASAKSDNIELEDNEEKTPFILKALSRLCR